MRVRPRLSRSRWPCEDPLPWTLLSAPRRCGSLPPPPIRPMLRFFRFRLPAKGQFVHPRDAPGRKAFLVHRETSAATEIGGSDWLASRAIPAETVQVIE